MGKPKSRTQYQARIQKLLPLLFPPKSGILIMPFRVKCIVTNIGKITQTEAVHFSHKSSVFSHVYSFLRHKMMQKLIDAMEDDDDVQNVWHNWEE